MIRRMWPLILAAIPLGISVYVLAGVLPQIADSLATTLAMVGLGVTTFTVAYAISGLFLSRLLTRGSTGRALLIALGLFNLGNLITTLAPGIEILLIGRIFAGAGAGVITVVATATAGAMVPARERGHAMSMVIFGVSTGTVVGVPLGMLVAHFANWRWTMGLVVAIGVLSMVAVASRARTLPRLEQRAHGSVFAVLRSPRTTAGVLVAFFVAVACLGLYTYLLPIADQLGFASWSLALVLAWGIGGVTSSAVIGRFLVRWGPVPMLLILPTLLVVAFVTAWVSTNPILWLLATALWGAAGWAVVPVIQQAITADRPNLAVPIIAMQMAGTYLGTAAGAAVGGVLLGAGTNRGDLAGWALVPTGIVIVLAGGIALAIRPVRATSTVPEEAVSDVRP